VPRTILFFGDSNMRGAGVGVEARFATLLAADVVASNAGWACAFGYSDSDLRVYPGRLAKSLTAHSPSIVVLQCPNGPLTFWINYPPWLRKLTALPHPTFQWILARHIEAAVKSHPAGESTRHTVLSESLYIDAAYRWNIAQWVPFRQVRRLCALRYGTAPKTTAARYVELIGRLRDQIRQHDATAKILVLGPLPQSQDYYPGHRPRAAAWSAELAAALHRPGDGVSYVELHAPLLRDGARDLLLRDGRHLTPGAHRRVADVVAPLLTQLISEVDQAPSPQRGERIAATEAGGGGAR
jgi:hypothetical protein